MDDGTDGRVVLQGETVRRTPQSAIAFHRIASRDRREEAFREGALTAEKRPVRKTDRVATNNDAVCSPEGIRTPDLFLEREAPWTTRRPGRALYTRIRSESAPDRDDRRHQDLHQEVVGVVQDPETPRLLLERDLRRRGRRHGT